MNRILLGSLLAILALAGCATTEDGKDVLPGNDTSGGDVRLDGYVPDGGDTLPGSDVLGDALPDGGLGDAYPDGGLEEIGLTDGSGGRDLSGPSEDLVDDLPYGFGEVFQQEACANYCLALSFCELTDGIEACETDCAAQLDADEDFGVKLLCTVDKYFGEQTVCADLAACAEAQVDARCEAVCLRVGQCGMYQPPLNEMWGDTYNECLLSCSAGAATEGFDQNLVCIVDALGNCSDLSVLECFGQDLKNCESLCDLASNSSASPGIFGASCQENLDCESGYCVGSSLGSVCSQTCMESCPQDWNCEVQPGPGPDTLSLCVPYALDGCNLIGQDLLFADRSACQDWCVAQKSGPVFAAYGCVDILTNRDYFGFERPGTCAEMATEACFPADLSLPPGALAFSEAFEVLCNVEGGEIPLPEILAWHVAGVLAAAGLLETADFYAAKECLDAQETCPGESGWLDCFVADKWQHSEAVCTRVIECMVELNPEEPQDMTVGDCLFVTNFNQTSHASELADIWTCVQAAGEVCLDVKACVDAGSSPS